MRPSRLAPLCFLALAACGQDAPRDAPVTVSIIGKAALADPNRLILDPAEAALIGATGQGLVRFDASGQIEPGLAMRWDVSDDGLYYTFRIAPGSAVDAEAAARRLRAVIATASRNPLRHVLGAISEIVAVTPEVIEIRLIAPRSDMLSLLAQPELAIDPVRGRTGPLRVERRTPDMLLLAPLPGDPEDRADWNAPARKVRLHGEPAAQAVARFALGGSELVLGGTFSDLAVARAADPRGRRVHFDPAPGLFGIAFLHQRGLLADPALRRSLSGSVDRDRIASLLALPGWTASSAILRGANDVAQPPQPGWATEPLDQRRSAAAALVASAVSSGADPHLTVALPGGPGSRMLFALLKQDWSRIGITLDLATSPTRADLALVDEVAPGGSAAWHLRHFTCDRSAVCSPEADAELAAARAALSLDQRSLHLAAAAALLEGVAPFVPLGQPIRWMLVGQDLPAVRENPRAAHPLYHLHDSD